LKESWQKEHQAKREYDIMSRKKSTASNLQQSSTWGNSRASLDLTNYSNKSKDQ